MSSEPTIIGIAVVECHDRFLVGTRSGNSTLAGMAEFPGGKVEAGESPQQCAARETLEETGLRVCAQELICRTVETYDHGTVELHFWRCTPSSDQLLPRPPFHWVSRDELCSRPFPSGNTDVLRLLTRHD